MSSSKQKIYITNWFEKKEKEKKIKEEPLLTLPENKWCIIFNKVMRAFTATETLSCSPP